MARGGGYCYSCAIILLFLALLTISSIALVFVIYIYLSSDYIHTEVFNSPYISMTWNLFGILTASFGLVGILEKKPNFLNLGSLYFYIFGTHKGFCVVIIIFSKRLTDLKDVMVATEPLFMDVMKLLGNKQPIIIISHLVLILASFYFALIVKSCQENISKNKDKTFNTIETAELL